MIQLAALIGFTRKELLEKEGLLFLAVSSFLASIVLNVITHFVWRTIRKPEIFLITDEDEVDDESR